MSSGKGIAIGFVAGVAMAGGAFLLLRDNTGAEREAARLAELDAHIQQLDETVSRLSERVTLERPTPVVAAVTPQSAAPATAAVVARKIEASDTETIAQADALVDQGIQGGHWSRQQSDELHLAIAELDVKEQGRILARVSAAINAGQIRPEMPRASH